MHYNHDIPLHTNGYIDVNGIPYVLAEYLDRRSFLNLDTSYIANSVSVDLREAMRAVIDININTIGTHDGRIASIGNNTKYRKLIEMMKKYSSKMDHVMNVIKPGLIVRVFYQLENCYNGNVIRSVSEDFRINNPKYFVSINSNNINDNAVIQIYNDILTSTISEFTHGRERMRIRITKIELLYECVKNARKGVYTDKELASGHYGVGPWDDRNMYYYHRENQPINYIGDTQPEDLAVNPDWNMFNRFYHFDNGCKTVILHQNEINDPGYMVAQIPCGVFKVNKLFHVNPGHRLVFRFTIAKNDLTITGDSREIAQAIKAPYNGYNDQHCHRPHHDEHDTHINYLIDMLYKEQHENGIRERIINDLTQQISDLRNRLDELTNTTQPDVEEVEPIESEVPDPEPTVDPDIQIEPPNGMEPPEIVDPNEGNHTIDPIPDPDVQIEPPGEIDPPEIVEPKNPDPTPEIIPPTIIEGPSI